MHIECFKLNGVDYLRLAESYSVKQGDRSVQKKRIVANLGPLKRFDDGEPDFLLRLRQSFRMGSPLIPELAAYVNAPVRDLVSISFDRNLSLDFESDPKNIGYFLLEALFDGLGIGNVLSLHKSRNGIGYDLCGLAKLLCIGRVLSPASKLASFNLKDVYLLPIMDSLDWHDIYACLDDLDKKSDAILKRMNSGVDALVGRNTEVAFYDVTNYFFEIEDNDVDITDGLGVATVKGLRKRGVSKENRRSPIVQMGLFVDCRGIPISYHLFPGNTLDQATLRPALKRTVDRYTFDKLVVVADRGLTSDKNIAHILENGNGYIFSKSIKKCNKSERQWVLDQEGYVENEGKSFKIKSKVMSRTIKNEDGESLEIKEKVVCYWSRKFYQRELKESEAFLQTLQLYIDNPAAIKSEKGKLRKFIDEYDVDEETGEVVDTKKVKVINLEKAQEFRDLMGYYMIVSSEIHKSESEIIDTYRGLTKIEDSFRIIKSDLKARPVFVNTPEHINAHFLICFIALTMMRIIQTKILEYQGKETQNTFDWEAGLSAARIQQALQQFNADRLPQGYYRLTKRSEEMDLILKAMGIDHTLRMPTLSELKQYRFQIRKTIK